MPLYDRIASLELNVDDVQLERLEQPVNEQFTRVTTVIHLHGGDHTGSGEDVCYAPEEHEPLYTEGLAVDLRGRSSFAELSGRLNVDLFPTRGPEMPVSRAFRRWGIESAALDLALRQRGTTLAQELDRAPTPVRFVASMHLDPPTSAERLRQLRARVPDVRFKLDARSEWDENFAGEVAALGGVEIIDLKGRYEGTMVEQPPDPDLYRLVADAFPEALLEDPALTPETTAALGPAGLARVSWDAPIHSLADVDAQPSPAIAVNVKPSRIGTIEELFRVYEALSTARIPMYGGGQMELGPGRGHIQLLASLFHPDGPNDVAPRPYNLPVLPETLVASPIPVSTGPGFSWEMQLPRLNISASRVQHVWCAAGPSPTIGNDTTAAPRRMGRASRGEKTANARLVGARAPLPRRRWRGRPRCSAWARAGVLRGQDPRRAWGDAVGRAGSDRANREDGDAAHGLQAGSVRAGDAP